jgi:peptidyl-prolyl cis-trans isomerase B (cyclophilin B)
MTRGKRLCSVLVLGVLMVTVPAGFARAAADANDFETEMDKVSYVIGTQIAAQVAANLKAQGIEVNTEMLARGIRDALTGQKLSFSPEEQNRIMAAFRQKMIAQQEAQALDKLGQDQAWKLKLTKPEMRQFDPKKEYFWVLETNKGKIRIKLMPDVAPMHVSSTMFLTEKGFYNGTTFHRVIPNFMAQGGCPVGDGRHGPGYQYAGEFSPNVKHDRPFLVSMANAGPNTDGSQFFITFVPTPGLDGKHTIFGEVVEGQDTVKKLEAAGGPPPDGKTTEKLKILKATVEEKAKG